MIVSIFPEVYPGEANTNLIPPPPQKKKHTHTHQNKPCRTNKNYLQDRALYLIITDPQPSILPVWIHHYPQHIYCSKYLHFSLHKYNEVVILYNSKMMEIDPIDKFMKLSKSLYTFTASIIFYCPTSDRNIIITICNLSCKLIKKSLIIGLFSV